MLDKRNKGAKLMQFTGARRSPPALVSVVAAAAMTLADTIMGLAADAAARSFERNVAHDAPDQLMMLCFGGSACVLATAIVFAVMWV